MESIGDFNRAISIVGHWIFYSNYKKALFFTQELLDILLYPSIGKELVPTFQSDVRYSWEPIRILKG